MKRYVLVSAALLAGCGGPTVVASFNGDSVAIQSSERNGPDDAVAFSEASRICSAAGRRAEYASSRQIYAPQYIVPTFEHLFLCLDPRTARSPISEGSYVEIGPAVASSVSVPTSAPASASPSGPSALAPVPTQTQRLPGHRLAAYGCPGFAPRVLYSESPEKLPKNCERIAPL